MPNAQDLRRAAGWRAGCSAVGMTDKAIRSGHWFGQVLPIRDIFRGSSSGYFLRFESIRAWKPTLCLTIWPIVGASMLSPHAANTVFWD